MLTALTLGLVIFSVFLHELGHALYMRKYGISIDTFSIGLPLPPKFRFRSEKILGGAVVQVTPFLLGAYVKPTKEGAKKLEELPYPEQADIYSAGPIANLLFALIILIGFYAFYGVFDRWFFGYTALFLGIFIGRRPFGRFLLPLLGIAALGFVVWGLFTQPLETVKGPVGMVRLTQESVQNVSTAIVFAGILSFAIGFLICSRWHPLTAEGL